MIVKVKYPMRRRIYMNVLDVERARARLCSLLEIAGKRDPDRLTSIPYLVY